MAKENENSQLYKLYNTHIDGIWHSYWPAKHGHIIMIHQKSATMKINNYERKIKIKNKLHRNQPKRTYQSM